MASVTDSRLDLGTIAVSPALNVSINSAGIVVPRLDGPPEFFSGFGRPGFDTDARYLRPGRAGLLLLEALARPDRSAVDAEIGAVASLLSLDRDGRAGLERLVDGLVETSLLVPDPSPPRGDSGADTATLAPATRWPRTDPAADGSPQLDRTRPYICPVPVAFPVGPEGFDVLDHDGHRLASIDATDVLVASSFRGGALVDEAREAFVEEHGIEIAAEDFEGRAGRLVEVGVCRAHDEQPVTDMREAVRRRFEAFKESDDAVVAALEAERERLGDTGTARALVIPMDVDEIPPLSLGMVLAYAKAYGDGALDDRIAFAPLWNTTVDRLPSQLGRLGDWPFIFLFSHYAWTSGRNLAMAAQIKELLPRSITIHGGPSAPKYEGDAEKWFADHPQVDVLVRGEGEATLAEALDALGTAWTATPDGVPDLSVLAEVAGLSYRSGDGLVRTEDRERLADLDTVPSPYLTGIFDHLKRFQAPSLILETNRGCPYGCTFCDWGSATLSRIRKFDLDRVKAEMEWAAQRHLEFFMVADANFGMLDRDVEIVEWAVELKKKYGAPSEFWVNYAKNKVGNLAKIVRILREGGIGTQCVASVQSFDAGVLKTIRRSNIKLERYDALTDEFRLGHLPLYTDVMIGLPGATVETVRNDLQAAIDRELQVRALPLQLLVNSPMNEPVYREEQGIEAAPDEVVKKTRTYDEDDWWEMMATRRFFYFAERSGVLRQLATYARATTGTREIDFYQLVRDTAVDRTAWPHLAWLVFVAPDEFLPPGSWWPVIAEVGRLMVDRLDVADDSGLEVALGVQHALLPARGRRLPLRLELPHDYAAWHADVLDAKLAHTDGTWPDYVRPLSSYEPASFEVRDDDRCCELLMGQGSADAFVDVAWELDSPVARPKEPRERVN